MIVNPGTLVLYIYIYIFACLGKSVKKPKYRDQEKVTKSKEELLDHETRNIKGVNQELSK